MTYVYMVLPVYYYTTRINSLSIFKTQKVQVAISETKLQYLYFTT